MKLISIVLPVYNVQAYLRQCIDSLLEQSYPDFEIVAVDDRSPDRSGEILAEYAARDPRVRVVTAPRNLGLGHARNLGLEHAKGEYVWFLDSDDWLAPGSLAAVVRRLRETGADVLIAGWDRVHWNGKVDPGPEKRLAEAPETFTAQSWPDVLDVLHVAWNKVVRRDLLTRLGLEFETGWYEDVSYTYPLLVAAERMTILPRTCVHYRQRRSGAITRTVGDRHFEVFDHWERALDLAGDVGGDLRGRLFRRMIWHYLQVLRHETRVPAASRRRFFHRMAENFRRFRPPSGFPPPPSRGERLRFALVERGSYPAFRLTDLTLRRVRQARRAARQAVRAVKRPVKLVRQGLYQLAYAAMRRLLPIDQSLALYAAYWYRGVSCNPAAIAAKAAELAPRLRPLWVVGRDRVAGLPPGADYVVAGTFGYYRALARARYLINNVNWPNHVVKRRGTTHVMTHHGTPLKMMGMDQLDHPASIKDTDFAAQMRRADRWDYSISSNPHTTIAWERAYPCRYETLEVGYPRNDRLATATPADAAAVRERLGLAPGRRVVLYAPTHREWLPPGQPVLDVEQLAEALGPDSVLLVRAHYFNVPPPKAGAASAGRAPALSGDIVDVSGYPVVEDLYLAADVMVTDYSSAMFDFAVLDKPIVAFVPDWQVYQELRGTYFDLMAEPPGAIVTNFEALREIFNLGTYAGPQATSARAAFRAKFCALEDGRAAERVVRKVFLNQGLTA